nr:reverse transcriptase domain-containing protein [Tanacetum cinerariifolium]
MEELCQPSLNGRGGPITPIAIQATNFGLKNDMIQQVQNSYQFHGLPGDDANKYLDKFLHVTQSIKVNGFTNDALYLYLFPHSLTHHATAWFDRLLRNSINTFEQMAKMFLGKYFSPFMVTKLRNKITNFRQRPDDLLFKAWECYRLSIDRCPNHNMFPVTQIDTFYNDFTLRHRDTINAAAGGTFMKRRPKECYDLIENMTAHHNDWDTSAKRSESSSSITSSSDTKIATLKAEMAKINKNLMRSDCPATVGQTQNVYAAGAYQGNAITDPKEDLKGITTQSGTGYQGSMIPTTISSLPLTLLTNKYKLSELARTPLNEHCLAVLLKKFPEKPGDPDKFLILCDFLGMAECLALTDLGASINLMPLSVWNKLSLPDLSPTCMTLELFDRLISHPVGVSEDIFVKVGTFHFSADFVVVDFDADPRVPLILGRSFPMTGRTLIDVFEGELTLRVGKEAITFNLDQTLRYLANYNDMTANRIDVIDMDCEEQSDFLLEEVDAFLALEDDPTSSEVDQSYFDIEGDILLLEAFLNIDPSLPASNQGNYLPQVRKELKTCEAKTDKSSIDEPPEEKTALIMVLKLYKRAIAWKLSDIKGIDPEFYTYKILMEEEFEPTVQHQRRVNPKIHDVIKNEVLKLLDAGLIYPISDSPWVSPVHCVPKKGGFTVIENEENELIPTRLVTGWRVCIDYRKLNEATHKDHFPLPFMDQMLERLAENEEFRCQWNVVPTEKQILQGCEALLVGRPLFVQNLCGSSHLKIWDPHAIISDRGMHFCNDQFAKVMLNGFNIAITDMSLNQGDDMGNTNEQPNVEDAQKYDWFKKPPRSPTPDPEWNKGKSIDDEPI